MSAAVDPGVKQPRADAPPGPLGGDIGQIRTEPVATVDQVAAKLAVAAWAGRQVQVTTGSALTAVLIGPIVGRVRT